MLSHQSRCYEREILANYAPPDPEYGRDFPDCDACGHPPKEHKGGFGVCYAEGWPPWRYCPCDQYREPEASRRAHSR
jgi:hypothetical protein